MMSPPTTKLWTKVPGTGHPTWKPTQPLTYVMGSYTLVARYRNAWDHNGRYTVMIHGYVLSGPGVSNMPVWGLGEAKTMVKNRLANANQS
jgi:hypothetical protein